MVPADHGQCDGLLWHTALCDPRSLGRRLHTGQDPVWLRQKCADGHSQCAMAGRSSRVSVGVCVQADRQTHRQTDRQTDAPSVLWWADPPE